jgi:Ricin-type beta-trefoil lectin domain-like
MNNSSDSGIQDPGVSTCSGAPHPSLIKRSRTRSLTRLLLFSALIAGPVGQCLVTPAAAQEPYYRLQLKNGSRYLDADHCSDKVGLNPGSNYDNGSCQLWRFVPAGDGWSRLQLKNGDRYLDADHCSDKVGLNPGSNYDNGSCQLWRLVPAGGGWSRLQLKNGGRYLDADHCSDRVGLNPGSNYDNGSCQLWRFVPNAHRID